MVDDPPIRLTHTHWQLQDEKLFDFIIPLLEPRAPENEPNIIA